MTDVPDVPIRAPRPHRRGYERLRDLLLVALLATIAVASVLTATRGSEVDNQLRSGGSLPVRSEADPATGYAGGVQPLPVRVVPSPAELRRRERGRGEARCDRAAKRARGRGYSCPAVWSGP